MCIAVLAGLGGQLRAQQLPQYTQYVFNHFNVNPAVAGSKDCIDVRLGFRKQWLGFEGAPTTGWASVHGTIKRKRKPYITSKHGVGMMAEADETGPIGHTVLAFAYAYHLQLRKGYYMSMGLFAGLRQQKFDVGRVTLENFNDPVLDSRSSVIMVPVITPGIWVYSNTFWAGASLHQVTGNRMVGIGEQSRATGHLMMSGGYRLRVAKQTSLTPSTLLKYSAGSPLAIDVNLMMDHKRLFGLGVGWRNQDAIIAMVKFGFLKYFALGYSYDVTTSRLKASSSNTHEIILAITPCVPVDPRKMIVRCPIFE